MVRNAWVLIASGTLASVAAAPVLAADAGFYFSAAVGRAEQNPGASLGTDLVNSSGVVGHVYPDRIDVDSGDVAWNAAVGYRINPYVAAEVEYMDLGTTKLSEHYSFVVSDPFPNTPASLTYSYSSKVTGPALSVLGSVPFSKGFEVFLRAGVFFADREADPRQQAFRSTVWLGGAGAAWSFASRWTLRAEYERTGELDATPLAVGADAERVSLSLLFRL